MTLDEYLADLAAKAEKATQPKTFEPKASVIDWYTSAIVTTKWWRGCDRLTALARTR